MVRYAFVVLLMLTLPMSAPLTGHAQDATPIPSRDGDGNPGLARRRHYHGDLGADPVAGRDRSHPSPAIVDVWLATLAPGRNSGLRPGRPRPASWPTLSSAASCWSSPKAGSRCSAQRGARRCAPDTVVTIHPGEAVIYVDNQAAQTFRNPGRRTLTAISFGVFSAAPPSTFTEGAGEPGGLGALRPGGTRSDRQRGAAHGAAAGQPASVRSRCPDATDLRGGGGRGPGRRS